MVYKDFDEDREVEGFLHKIDGVYYFFFMDGDHEWVYAKPTLQNIEIFELSDCSEEWIRKKSYITINRDSQPVAASKRLPYAYASQTADKEYLDVNPVDKVLNKKVYDLYTLPMTFQGEKDKMQLKDNKYCNFQNILDDRVNYLLSKHDVGVTNMNPKKFSDLKTCVLGFLGNADITIETDSAEMHTKSVPLLDFIPVNWIEAEISKFKTWSWALVNAHATIAYGDNEVMLSTTDTFPSSYYNGDIEAIKLFYIKSEEPQVIFNRTQARILEYRKMKAMSKDSQELESIKKKLQQQEAMINKLKSIPNEQLDKKALLKRNRLTIKKEFRQNSGQFEEQPQVQTQNKSGSLPQRNRSSRGGRGGKQGSMRGAPQGVPQVTP